MDAFEYSTKVFQEEVDKVPMYLSVEQGAFREKMQERCGRTSIEYLMREYPSKFLVAAFLGWLASEGFDVVPKNKTLEQNARYVRLVCTINEYGSTRENSLACILKKQREQVEKNLYEFHLERLLHTFYKDLNSHRNYYGVDKETSASLEDPEDFNDPVAVFAFKRIVQARGFVIIHMNNERINARPSAESIERAMNATMQKMNVAHQQKVE